MKRYHRLEKAIALALILCGILMMAGFAEKCEDISTRVVRLHVLANSDSVEDQALKLKVRDRILTEAQGLLGEMDNKPEALRQLNAAIPALQTAAEDEITRQGYSYPVSLTITNMYFNTREYKTITLPAGMYDALRVTIGSGKGKNWWCVVFPPMCLSAATEEPDTSAQLDAVLPADELNIVENADHYEVRFKLVEWFEEAREWLRSSEPGACTPSESHP
jgi:stage II sporulation protein R